METPIFVGRKQELKHINQLVRCRGGSQVLFIVGLGGIGKTRLLNQILQIYTNDSSLIVFPIIDFDDTSHRLELNIFNIIAGASQDFSNYFQQYNMYRNRLGLGISQSSITEEKQRTKEKFFSCYNGVVKSQRGILLFDTVELINQDGLWINLIQSLSQLNNSVIIFAGREYSQAKKAVDQFFDSSELNVISLEPFTKNDSLQYLDYLAPNLDQTIKDKLFTLTKGHPILLTLAIEWLARDEPFLAIQERTVEDLNSLDDNDRGILEVQFDEVLVNQLLEPRRLLDNVIIQMAYVHRRFNQEILSFLLNLSTEESNDVIRDLARFPFVKTKTEGITLHDEMRALVNKYIWPKIDPLGLERRELAKRMIQYYNENIERIMTTDDLLWFYKVERLYYQLGYNLDGGYENFTEVFDEVSRAYRFSFYDLLLNEIRRVQNQYPAHKLYEIEIREAKALLDEARLQEVTVLLQRILKVYTKDEQQAEILISLGHAKALMGEREAVRHFERAVEISRSRNLDFWLMRSLNELGWQYRIRGNLDPAMKFFEEALEISIKLETIQDQAWILNNIAFILAISVNLQEALAACDQALEILQELDDSRGIGIIYETYGIAYRKAEQFDKAYQFFDEALAIFEPANDKEWLSRIYLGRGHTHWVANQPEKAEKDLKKALKFGIKKDEANILHQLSHAYMKQDKLAEAQEALERSYAISMQTADAYYECNGLGDLIRLAGMTGQVDRLDKFAEMYEGFRQRWSDSRFTNVKGRLLKYLGDLALQATPDDVTRACDYYKQAFPLLIHLSYSEFSVSSQLKDLNDLIKRLEIPPQQVSKLGKCLYDTWKDETLGHPMALRFFFHWMNRETVDDVKKYTTGI